MKWRLVDTMQRTSTTAGVSSYLDSAKQQEVSPVERILDENLRRSHSDRGGGPVCCLICLQEKGNKTGKHTVARSGGLAVLASACLPVAALDGAEMRRARNSKQKTTSQNVTTTPSVALKMCPSVLWKKATALSPLRSFRAFQCLFSHYRSPVSSRKEM